MNSVFQKLETFCREPCPQWLKILMWIVVILVLLDHQRISREFMKGWNEAVQESKEPAKNGRGKP